MTVKWISLVNLILGESLVPEFWRLPVRAASVADALRPLLTPLMPRQGSSGPGWRRCAPSWGAPGRLMRVAALALGLLPC